MELIVLQPNELNDRIREAIRSELKALLPQDGLDATTEDPLMKRKDVALLFGVSLPCIHAWMNSGQLPFHRIGRRVFFKRSEVMESLTKIKIRKKYQ